jgi:protocatechuate 3,4-dioxygenase beta subunit
MDLMKVWMVLICSLFLTSLLSAEDSKINAVSVIEDDGNGDVPETMGAPGLEKTTDLAGPSLWGKVMDAQNQALGGATLEWTPMTDVASTMKTISDAGGNVFLFHPLERQKNDVLICRHEQFATWGKCHVDSKSFGSDNTLFEIHMSTGAGIDVDLVTADGKPLAGANIFFKSPLMGKGHSHDTILENVLSDKRGRAVVNQYLPNKVKLEIDIKGWTTFEIPNFDHGITKSSIKVDMVKAKPFKLYFEDVDGLALNDVVLQYGVSQEKLSSFDQLPDAQRHELKSKTSSNAEFQVPIKSYLHLKLTSKKYIAQPILNLDCTSLSSYKYILEALTEISGSVIDATTNEAIAKASVKIKYGKNGQRGMRTQSLSSNKKGKFSSHLKLDGTIQVIVLHTDYKPFEMDIKKTSEMNAMIIPLAQGETVGFRLMQPVPYNEPAIIAHRKVNASVTFLKGGSHHFDAETNALGEFKSAMLSTGDSLKIQVDGFAEAKIEVDLRKTLTEVLLSPACSIEMTVSDEEKHPLQGVSFYIGNDYQPAEYLKEAQSYLVKNIKPGQFKLKVQKYEYENQWIDIEAELGKVNSYNVKMEKCKKLAVTIDPFEGLAPDSVMFNFKLSSYGSSSISASLVKGSKPPRYEAIYQENYIKYPLLSVQMKGYLPQNIELTGSFEYTIQLEKGLMIIATVNDTAGVAIKGAEVSIWDHEYSIHIREKSNDEGKAELSGLSVSKYQVNIVADGFAKSNFQWSPSTGVSTADWTLSRGGALRVGVMDENGTRVEGADIQLQKSQDWGGFQNVYELGKQGVVQSDEQGFAEFSGVPNGDYRVICNDKKHGLGESKVFKLEDGGVQTIELILKSGLSISGRVVDATGEAIVGVKLMASRSDGLGGGISVKDTSDEDGDFSIQPLKEGVYMINIDHKDYDKLNENRQFEAGEKNVILQLQKSQKVILEAIDPNGKPLSNVNFFHRNEIQNYENQLHDVFFDGAQYSISTNRFNFNSSMGKSFVIKAKAEGYNPGESKSFTYGEWPEKIVVQLKKESRIEFVCQDEFGNPISGVQATNQEKNANGMFRQMSQVETISQKDGHLLLKGIEEGSYQFVFKHKDFSDVMEEADVRYEDTSLHKVVMKKGGVIKGYVKDMNNEPMAGAYVWIQSMTRLDNFMQQMSAQTNPVGDFEILRVPEGEYKISFRAKGSAMMPSNKSSKTITVRNGEICNVNFVEERVENAGRVEVNFPESEAGQRYFGNLTRKDFVGQNFSGMMKGDQMMFENVPAGQYTLTLFGTSMRSIQLEVKIGETTICNLEEQKGYKLLAKIVDEAGRSVAMGWASLVPSKMDNNGVLTPMINIKASGKISSGRLEIFVTQAGRFNLMIQVQNGMGLRTLNVKDVEVLDGQDTDLGTLQLKAGVKLSGRVLDETGYPISGAMFMANSNGMPQSMPTWRSNNDGHFELDGVPDEPFQLNVYHSDFAAYKMDIAGASDVSIVLHKGTELLIQLTGTSISGRTIFLTNEEKVVQMNALFSGRFGGQQVSNELGQLTLPHVESGRYRVQIIGNQGDLKTSVYSEVFDVFGSGQQRVDVPLTE